MNTLDPARANHYSSTREGGEGRRRSRERPPPGDRVSGRHAERLVEERLRAALPPGAFALANVRWLAPAREGGPARDGEIDLLIVDPDRGLLVVEVKAGPVRRDGFGRWYAGSRDLPESPFRQAETGKWAIRDKITADPRWLGAPPRMLHAVAFPETDHAHIAGEDRDLGPDAPHELVIDRADLHDDASARRALDRVFGYWSGDEARDRPLGEDQLAIIRDVLEPEVRLRPLLAGDIEEGEHELLVPTHHQMNLLTTLRGHRRASIQGAAGSGKTLLAVEKAHQLAAVGFNVLLVCFNQPLARALAHDPSVAPHIASGRLTVGTFHELCRRFGTEAGVLPPPGAPSPGAQPVHPDREWFDVTLPRALADAIPVVGGRWQALVIDEGQDFASDWLTTLALLLSDPDDDVIYVFHDPAQAIYRADATDTLGLEEFPLPDNCRNARPIHEFAFRWYGGDLVSEPMREDGRPPEVVEAEPGQATLDALRDVLHRLVHVEHVERERIAVLSGVSLEHSAAWRQRRFKGDLVLWNGSVADDGTSLGLPVDRVPDQPPRTILIDTIHRFKGLERDVVVLVELRPDDERLSKLLYIGASRAKHHLIAVVTPELAQRLA
jgi:hypothetical protein